GHLDQLYAANVQGTDNLLCALRRYAPEARILVVSSSAVYGYAGEQPITEDTPRNPVTSYGESKAAQEDCALLHRLNGMHIRIARPFNLAGPGQSPAFVCGSIVHQVCAIRKKHQQSIQLRDRTSRRDFVDVRDAVRAYWALLTSPLHNKSDEESVFNIGSEKAVSIGQLITLAEEVTGMRIPTEIIPGSDNPRVPVQVSDCSRIRCKTEWQAEIPLSRTLEDMLRTECEESIFS
ncbi:MAG: GDP-mannose 4,6-dehydratase, partial [Methanomicrobiales archaeon]|nr:GDP-mannose 4,6-dehydratase [Methanomicrobiales archaeon]